MYFNRLPRWAKITLLIIVALLIWLIFIGGCAGHGGGSTGV